MKNSGIVKISFILLACSFLNMNAKSPIMPGDTVNILWIGNSYTYFNDLPSLFKEIAKNENITVNNTRLLKGGEKFEGHLNNPGVIDTIGLGGWDYVILQEFSSTPANSTKYVAENIYPYAETLDSLIHKSSPDAKTVLYMTWGHRNGNVRSTPYPFDDTYDLMQDRITRTYLDLAYELGAMCAPVGLAWQTIMKDYPNIDLYNPDNFHPALSGSWLAANTIFETLYQKPFTTPAPEGLSPEEALTLQKVAQQTVLNNSSVLNLK